MQLTKFLGRKRIYYPEIDSTQNEIWRRIEKNTIENGLVVMAGRQTEGKGTHGRVWHTDEEGDIAFSFYVETNCNMQDLEGLTKEIAEILVAIFWKKYKIQLEIKEPNDLMYHGKKLGGILTESKVQAGIIKYLVIGIGINTNKMHFSQDIQESATSIRKEFGVVVENDEILSKFYNQFEKEIRRRIHS